jgi:transposase
MSKCKQRVRAVLLFHQDAAGIELPSWSQSHLDVLRSVEMPAALQFSIESHLAELRSLEENRSVVEAQIDTLIRACPERHQRYGMLMTVPGVGRCVAMTFVAELFQPERLTCATQVSSYLGLAPIVHHSGERTPRGHLRAVGQKHLRSLLIEASWTFKQRDAGMQKIYNQVLARTGIAQKAIVAVARRLAVILWRIALENRPYYPTPL